MNFPETKPSGQVVANYLQSMQRLQSEMVVAMECIAANDLTGFQESVARQEGLCGDLVPAAKSLHATPSFVPADVRAANQALRQKNLEYAALVRHSSRTLLLLSSLCRTYTGQPQEAHSTRSKHQTWSCEA